MSSSLHISNDTERPAKVDCFVNKAYRIVLPLLAIWLISWIALSWAAIQDDALIHLRYADNLFRTHRISYDGVHPTYGASSLLYVNLLAFLRGFIQSPCLPRGVSSVVHILLAASLAIVLIKCIPQKSGLARLLGLTLLFISVTPSAVRWLDDGMETGLVLCFATCLCVATFRQSVSQTTPPLQYFYFVALAFFTVLLRTELILLCAIAFVILVLKKSFPFGKPIARGKWLSSILTSSHVLLGSSLALAYIAWKMHSLLPDTALAKANGIANWQGVLFASATVLGGAISFGVGLMLFWLLTVVVLLRAEKLLPSTVFANAVFPIVLALAALRGQQVQGARYLVWTFFFSSLWNILELGLIPPTRIRRQGYTLAYGFLVLILVILPFESTTMFHVLTARAHTMKVFERQHLDTLRGKQGIASDVGYIGYFSQANICDLAGLVNGRDRARLSEVERAQACVATHPDFLFLNRGQIESFSRLMDLHDWQACSPGYDFVNVRTLDTHYLLAHASNAVEICRAASDSVPVSILRIAPGLQRISVSTR